MQVGKGAPPLVEPEAVSREELVGHGEADEPQRELVHQAPVGAVEERHRSEARGIPQAECSAEEVQREPCVDDVLDEENMPAFECRVGVLEEAHAAVLPIGVRGELDDIERVGDRERPREVGEEDDTRLERRDENRVEICIRPSDLRAELGHPLGDLRARQVDGAHLAVVRSLRLHHYEARRSR